MANFPVHSYGLNEAASYIMPAMFKKYGLDKENLWNSINLNYQAGGGEMDFTKRQSKMLGNMAPQVNETLKMRQQQEQQTLKAENHLRQLKIFNQNLAIADQMSKMAGADDMPLATKQNILGSMKKTAEAGGLNVDFTPYDNWAAVKDKLIKAKRESVLGENGSLPAFNANPNEQTHMRLMADLDALKGEGQEIESIRMAANATMLETRKKQADTQARGQMGLEQELNLARQDFNVARQALMDPDGGLMTGAMEEYKRLEDDYKQRVADIRYRFNSYNPAGGAPGFVNRDPARSDQQNRTLSEQDAQAILAEAGYDPVKARLLAKERGYKWEER